DCVRQIIGDYQCAARVHRYTHGTAARRAVFIAKAGNEINGLTCGLAIAERYEHDLVANRIRPIPTAMLAHEYAIGEIGTHGFSREVHATRSHVCPKAVVGLDGCGHFLKVLRTDELVYVLSPVAIRPTVEAI